MRAVIQRVQKATVTVEQKSVGSIQRGLLVFLGIEKRDTQRDILWLSNKIVRVRIFEGAQKQMEESVLDIKGGILLISQFTLWGNLHKGSRPSFQRAAAPKQAIALYEQFIEQIGTDLGKPVATGCFGAMMNIEAIHDGPVTLFLDSHQKDF